MTDGELATKMAKEAGALLMRLRATSGLTGKLLGDAGDISANKMLLDILEKERPGDGVLSEESKDTADRLSKQRVWIIDPLDGTREYGEGRDDWAVHIGLAVNGHAALGVVALPSMNMVLRSDEPIRSPLRSDKPRMLVSRSRPAKEALMVAKKMDADIIEMGSAGAKAMAVVRGEADIYLHSGGQYEWDNCAPVAVAQAHNLHCSRIDGSELRYNEQETFLPDLLICHKQDARPILGMIANNKIT